MTGRSPSEIGPTTATSTIARTAATRPAAPLKRCSRTEPLASGERRVVIGSSVASHLLDISPSYAVRSSADHPRAKRAATLRRGRGRITTIRARGSPPRRSASWALPAAHRGQARRGRVCPAARPPAGWLLLWCLQHPGIWVAPGASSSAGGPRGPGARFPRFAGHATSSSPESRFRRVGLIVLHTAWTDSASSHLVPSPRSARDCPSAWIAITPSRRVPATALWCPCIFGSRVAPAGARDRDALTRTQYSVPMRRAALAVRSEVTKEAFNATDHGPARAASRAFSGDARSPWRRNAPNARRRFGGRADAPRDLGRRRPRCRPAPSRAQVAGRRPFRAA